MSLGCFQCNSLLNYVFLLSIFARRDVFREAVFFFKIPFCAAIANALLVVFASSRASVFFDSIAFLAFLRSVFTCTFTSLFRFAFFMLCRNAFTADVLFGIFSVYLFPTV